MYSGNGLQLTTKKGMYLISWTRSKVWKIFLNLPHSHILSWNFSPSYRKRWGYQLFEKAVVLLWLPPLSNNLFPLFLVSIICHPSGMAGITDDGWIAFFLPGFPLGTSCPSCMKSFLMSLFFFLFRFSNLSLIFFWPKMTATKLWKMIVSCNTITIIHSK